MTAAADLTRLDSRLEALLGRYARRRDTGQVHLALARPGSGWSWSYGDPAAPYFVASITKLYTTAIVLQLVDEGAVALDAPLSAYLPADVVSGLHVLRGTDRSAEITVRQLMSHTSGLADYFEQKRADGGTTFGRALTEDTGWTFADVLSITKEQLTPKFAPGTPGKAFYSDTNFQLLGAVIEAVTGTTYARAVHERLAEPLGLVSTYVLDQATSGTYDQVAPIMHGSAALRIPSTMASVQADGGVVSTAAESLRLVQGFFAGQLFAPAHLPEIQAEWRRIFPPLRYGTGLMLFQLPRWTALGRPPLPPMVGHSGASGALAFRVPELDLDIAGTVNQVKRRSMPYQLMSRIVAEVRKAA